MLISCPFCSGFLLLLKIASERVGRNRKLGIEHALYKGKSAVLIELLFKVVSERVRRNRKHLYYTLRTYPLAAPRLPLRIPRRGR